MSTRTRWPPSRRRDLPALLDRRVPLGPDQAARRLGVRRVDFTDHMARLGRLLAADTVRVRFGAARGGTVRVPLR